MHRLITISFCAVLMFAPWQVFSSAEPIRPDNVAAPGPNRSDEPIAKQFSLDRAANFLDSTGGEWACNEAAIADDVRSTLRELRSNSSASTGFAHWKGTA